MALNKVSAVVTQETVDTSLVDIKSLEAKYPFLISLSSDERQALPKPGEKSLSFIERCLELTKQKPNFLPRNFSIEEMQKDIDLYKMLLKVDQPVLVFAQKISDTTMEVYAESYIAALKIYNEAKDAGEELAGFDDVIDELAKRFTRKSKTKTENPTAK